MDTVSTSLGWPPGAADAALAAQELRFQLSLTSMNFNLKTDPPAIKKTLKCVCTPLACEFTFTTVSFMNWKDTASIFSEN